LRDATTAISAIEKKPLIRTSKRIIIHSMAKVEYGHS
jgi:hypothetical protein